MLQGKVWVLISFATIVLMVMYFMFNPSYERSIQAKYYYATGEYKTAHRLATEAFELDSYNRMAATIMTQSQMAMKFVDYIEQSKAYQKQISAIANAKHISRSDKAKMKLICEIMMESYDKISLIYRDGRAVVLDEALVEEARKYHQQFADLYEKITAAL